MEHIVKLAWASGTNDGQFWNNKIKTIAKIVVVPQNRKRIARNIVWSGR